MEIFFWLMLMIILYTWFGYFVLLLLLNKLNKNIQKENICLHHITVLLAVHNEEKVIYNRIRNLFEVEYPKNLLEIIIASDGSTDKTIEIAKKYLNLYNNSKILNFKRRGKAITHNNAIKFAKGEIVVFTDADAEFNKDFLKNIVKYFSNEKVGCVVGNLIYKTKGTSISESEGVYWKFEKKLRELESRLGILATATGACMAVRRNLWKDLTPIDDSDFTTPLDVILQGFKVVYASDAIAYDVPPSSITGEFRARIRQTAKNLVGTLKRWGIKGWIKHPFISWGLLSHKILRWFTPFFMLGAFLSNAFLLNEGWIYKFAFIGQIAFYMLTILGFGGELFKIRIPIASTIFSFCIANIGMGIGVIKGLLGKAPAAYKMEE